MFGKLPPLRVAVVVATVVLAATVGPVAGGVADSASLRASASFSPSVVYEDRGDIATITVTTSDGGVVNIGAPSEAFWMQVRVGGGTTKLRLNTYRAGLASDRTELDRALSGGTLVNATPTPVSKPLATAKYDMNVTRTVRNDRELNIGKLVVEERETRGIEARIAPRATRFDEVTESSQIRSVTQAPWDNGSVARGDWVVVHVNATGLSGMLSKSRLAADGDDVTVAFEQSNSDMNADPTVFSGVNATRFVAVPEGFYLFVDTAGHGIEAGDRYNVSFVVAADSELADTQEVVSTSIEVVERRVSVERNGPGGAIVVDGETTITGSTSLTPGTTINVTARDTELPPLHRTRTVTVTPNRTFSATFDFSDLEPGREFEFRFPDQGKTVPAKVAGETTTETATPPTTTPPTTTPPNETTATPPTTTPPTTTTTTTTAPPTTTTTPNGTTEGLTQVAVDGTAAPLTQRAIADGTTGSGGGGGGGTVPGFGPVASVVAVVAAVLLAVRRR